MSESITHSEWLAAFEAALKSAPSGDEGMTTAEIAAAVGMSKGYVINRLHDLRRAGRLVAGYAYREALDGTQKRTPVYRVS